MAAITLTDVTQWLEATNFSLPSGDLETVLPEAATAEAKVLGVLTARYDTSEWSDYREVPQIVRGIIGMMTASWHYKKRYAETGQGNAEWAIELEREADRCLRLIMRGEISLDTTMDTSPDQVLFQKSNPVFKMDMVY